MNKENELTHDFKPCDEDGNLIEENVWQYEKCVACGLKVCILLLNDYKACAKETDTHKKARYEAVRALLPQSEGMTIEQKDILLQFSQPIPDERMDEILDQVLDFVITQMVAAKRLESPMRKRLCEQLQTGRLKKGDTFNLNIPFRF